MPSDATPRGWVMRQTWTDLLFAHWPVPVMTLRPVIPEPFEIDLFDGAAWIGVVPFAMSGIRARWLPALPGLSATLELNVRTYVRHHDSPGVYFFSLDAESLALVRGARSIYRLPYFHAEMSLKESAGWIEYESRRIHRNAPPAAFRARYRPTCPEFLSKPGSLEHWLTERYCLFTTRRDQIIRADIHHPQWPLCPAEAEFAENAMTEPIGVTLPPATPLLHFARKLDVVVWSPRVIA